MIESGYYPSGTQYQRTAPWCAEEVPEREFDVLCSQSLSKTATVFTQNYTPITEREYDGETYFDVTDYDTSNTDWGDEYHENDHYTPIQLIELFQKYLLDEVNGSCTVNKNNDYLNHLISECNNWTEDETMIVEN